MGEENKGDTKTQLQEANKTFTECLTFEFLPRFLSGENVKVEDFCRKEYSFMIELDRKVYGSIKNDWS